MTEAELVRKIVRALNQYEGVYCWRNHGGPYMKIGVSDVTGLRKGRFFAIEVKRPGKGNMVTANQKAFLDHVRESGGLAGVATTIAAAKEVISGRTPS